MSSVLATVTVIIVAVECRGITKSRRRSYDTRTPRLTCTKSQSAEARNKIFL